MTKRDVMFLAAGLALGLAVVNCTANDWPRDAEARTENRITRMYIDDHLREARATRDAVCSGFDAPLWSVTCPDGRRIELMRQPGVSENGAFVGEVYWREVSR